MYYTVKCWRELTICTLVLLYLIMLKTPETKYCNININQSALLVNIKILFIDILTSVQFSE